MRYSESFERDFSWYVQHRRRFAFDGKPDAGVVHEPKGATAKEAFKAYDERGKLIPTRHPNLLKAVLTAKGSVNLNIKQWAQDRAGGALPLILFSKRLANEKYPHLNVLADSSDITDMETALQLLPWMVTAVEQQKGKYYP